MHKSANNLLPVAKVLKSFGTEGGIIIRYNPQVLEEINEKRPVFIYFDGLPVPFFIEKLNDKATDQAFLKLEGMETRKLAEEVVGEIIYIERRKGGRFDTGQHSESNIPDIIGFEIFDPEGADIGTINSIHPYPNNLCIGVLRPGEISNEILMPLHDDFIVDIDIDNEKLILDLPKGILEI